LIRDRPAGRGEEVGFSTAWPACVLVRRRFFALLSDFFVMPANGKDRDALIVEGVASLPAEKLIETPCHLPLQSRDER
jgi:hypothetical protein